MEALPSEGLRPALEQSLAGLRPPAGHRSTHTLTGRRGRPPLHRGARSAACHEPRSVAGRPTQPLARVTHRPLGRRGAAFPHETRITPHI
ncbi:MAG: hypothetical protein OZSIB_0968 [Candidatus Ozemobacter sibiricus]|uniref:Uncharacterized protein n=1 Tax=Candidatus Ozemobacter sibiricus TaxID=2268124 RepID=A0A367ZL47_9BACT|nr:MAG: hypothetical protein OZSIB_0968 [Candidatus Ozemobacter sibiricus]